MDKSIKCKIDYTCPATATTMYINEWATGNYNTLAELIKANCKKTTFDEKQTKNFFNNKNFDIGFFNNQIANIEKQHKNDDLEEAVGVSNSFSLIFDNQTDTVKNAIINVTSNKGIKRLSLIIFHLPLF